MADVHFPSCVEDKSHPEDDPSGVVLLGKQALQLELFMTKIDNNVKGHAAIGWSN